MNHFYKLMTTIFRSVAMFFLGYGMAQIIVHDNYKGIIISIPIILFAILFQIEYRNSKEEEK